MPRCQESHVGDIFTISWPKWSPPYIRLRAKGGRLIAEGPEPEQELQRVKIS